MINSPAVVNSSFKRKKSPPFEYHTSFVQNNDTYKIQDFAVANGSIDIEVVKILCIYTTSKRKIQLVVRKYILARNLTERLLEEGCTKFDDNEVVEDFTKEYTISLDRIIRKCYMVYGEEHENYIISESNFNPLTHFSCRYSLTPNGLLPILLASTPILNDRNVQPHNNNSQKDKEKLTIEDIFGITITDSSGDENTPEKMKSSKDLQRNIRAVPQVRTLGQRNSVKRNLNKSFGDSPAKDGKSILNYSVITDEEDDDSLILKLRVSERNKTPVVVLNKGDDDSYTAQLKVKQQETPRSLRKSARVKVRKSYAEYISPVKSTPRKRGISESTTESGDAPSYSDPSPAKNSKNTNRSRDARKILDTPAKESPRKGDVISERSGHLLRTPRRYQNGEMGSPVRSARRSLRLTSTEEIKENTASPQSARSSKRRISTSSDRGGHMRTPSETPRKKVDLNESIRRTILKVILKKTELEEEAKVEVNNKPKSRGAKQFFYETSSEDESNKRCAHEDIKQSLRSRTPRSKSMNDKDTSVSDSTKSKHTIDSSDSDYSPPRESAPKTPRTLRTKRNQISPTSSEVVPNTPRSRRNISTPKSAAKTPRSRAKLIRDGVITPSMHARTKAVAGDTTPLKKARSQLHVSYVPTSLPCREKEYCDVFNFLEGKLLDGCGGCMYVSGVPGTGKTATVTAVVNHLLRSKNVPKFAFVNVNGMRLTEPRQSYVEILKQLTGKTVPWEQAQSMLEERFTKSKKLAPVVMVIDELDVLCTKRQDVVYNLLDWPSKAKSQLIVVTIANTMDLPERLLMSRVTSRLGLTRLTFQAYTHKQLQEIVTKRLTGTDSFNPDAVQFVARKVASVSGDARRALDICRRAAEIAEAEGKGQLVSMGHVNEALNAMITQPKVRAIKNCSRLEQLILQSIVAEVERTGVEETTLADVYKMLVSCAAIDGFKMISGTMALSAVSRLSACRLLLTDQKCSDINQRIVLNVSVDDVYYALK